MPVGLDSILQWKFFQSMDSQEILNVQYYRVEDFQPTGSSLTGFARALFNLWYTNWDSVQSSRLTYVRGELYEVNGLAFDIYIPDVAPTGTRTGDSLPVQDALSIQQVRQSRATRHGWKRMAGMAEIFQANGVVDAGILTAAQEAATATFNSPIILTDDADPTHTMQLEGIIWGGNDPAFPLGRYSRILETRVNPRITTQNTRKVGRGS